MNKIRFKLVVWLLAMAVVFTGCAIPSGYNQSMADPRSLRIEATMPIQWLEEAGIFDGFTKETGIEISLTYMGDVELLNKIREYSELGNALDHVDAMWAASDIYTPGSLLQDKTSIMRTYIVLGVSPQVADQLHWELGLPLDAAARVIDAIENGVLSLAVPSASQDDSGANFLFAAISAFAGKPYITSEDLQNPQLREQLRTLYSAVEGSSNNARALMEQFVQDQRLNNPTFNGFILPEYLAIEANMILAENNLTPMRLIYIEDAAGIENFSLGWIKGVSEEKQEQFDALVEYLKSDEIQEIIRDRGYFRVGSIGMQIPNPNLNIFKPEWGIITDRNFQPILLPKDSVIVEALSLYQSLFRKPSLTVLCMDYSRSMDPGGLSTIKIGPTPTPDPNVIIPGFLQRNNAMRIILDQTLADDYFLQMNPGDYTLLLPFSDDLYEPRFIWGNNPAELLDAYAWLEDIPSDGLSTNIYGCVISALAWIAASDVTEAIPAVIVLTDGVHNSGASQADLQNFYQQNNLTIHVYSIAMGEADPSGELDWIAQLTNGRVCDGTGSERELIQCFLDFRGSN